jgi:hypothetical protein
MIENSQTKDSGNNVNPIKNEISSDFHRGSISVLGEEQISPEELIARNPDLYGKPSVCQKL